MTEPRDTVLRSGMRAEQFSALMRYRVRQILLVASRYDSFLLEEEGQLAELLAREYRNLEINIRHVPRLVAAESGRQALQMLRSNAFDLVITTTRLTDMALETFAAEVRDLQPDLPLGVLVPHAWDIPRLAGLRAAGAARWVFLWQGDAKTLLAMIEQEEDRRNADADVLQSHVQAIIVVEDDVRFLSFFLPHLYAEVTQQTARLMSEGLNLSQRLLRLQARPKILLASTLEEAWELWNRYSEHALAVIADCGFPHAGRLDPRAGLELVRRLHGAGSDVPVLLQSSEPEFAPEAAAAGAAFVPKQSEEYVDALRRFLLDSCGFGDFVFRLADRTEVGRAANLREVLAGLQQAPEASVEYHASRNDFSRWFAARTEFELARLVRPAKVSDFKNLAGLRAYLVEALGGHLRELQRSIVADFDTERFDDYVQFARIGGGSLGGKGRGLAFVQRLLSQELSSVEGATVTLPQTVVVATDVFEGFLEGNALRGIGARAPGMTDEAILDAFRKGRFDRLVRAQLAALLEVVREPLAVRSSSLLEDSPYQPFAGVYATIMLPNHHPSLDVRLAQLLEAIKVVYASTYMEAARSYLETTPHRTDEERMGVLVQRLVGSRHGDRFYPLFSGVASSYNFYPFRNMRPEEGVALVAVGLGKEVVEGFEALRFCPAHPQVLPQFSSVKDVLKNAQRRFWALDMTSRDVIPGLQFDANLVSADVTQAMQAPGAALVASSYVRENDNLVDGLGRGAPLVTFARLLKGRGLPLPEMLTRILERTQAGMGMPVEIEFAADGDGITRPVTLYVLQVRPMVVEPGLAAADLERIDPEQLVVVSPGALGNGRTPEIRDVLVVRHDLERARTTEAAQALEKLNGELKQAGRPYLLIGPGRWGSRDPWLGIPVVWGQISGAGAIVEVDFDDLDVEPSQGSHFFHNLTSFGIPFLPVHKRFEGGTVNWEWLSRQPVHAAVLEGKVLHLQLDEALQVQLDGARRQGVVLRGQGDVTDGPR